ncbi:MAG: MFS transporter, partial [Hyphomicrobiales bacterium]
MAASAAKKGKKPTQDMELSQARRIAILITVVLSASLYGTTVLIVATILPQLQGAFSATADEISWAMTFNILATAVVTPMTGWLVAWLGRKNTIVGSAALFTFATYMCGTADSLEALIFWRIVQGAGGAPMTPLAQTIVLDIFPKKHHGLVVGLYGIGVMVGSMIGPILGGLMADIASWRWAFYLIVPLGIVASAGMSMALPRARRARHAHLDWPGFLLLSAAIAGLQLMLSRGQRLDWFDSTEIVI